MKNAEKVKENAEAAREQGRKAVMAYAHAGAEVGGHLDRFVRSQVGRATAATREAGELYGQALDSTLEAGEAMRRAGLDWMESAFTAGE